MCPTSPPHGGLRSGEGAGTKLPGDIPCGSRFGDIANQVKSHLCSRSCREGLEPSLPGFKAKTGLYWNDLDVPNRQDKV